MIGFMRTTVVVVLMNSLVLFVRLIVFVNVFFSHCPQEGTLVVDGADVVEIVFDRRCRLPRGMTLVLQGFGSSSAVGDWSDESSLLTWWCTGPDQHEKWDSRWVVVLGKEYYMHGVGVAGSRRVVVDA